MVVSQLVLAAGLILFGQSPEGSGTLGGVVVNASDQSPVAGAEVVLRMRVGGEFIVVAETTADAGGEFLFRDLPFGQKFQYLPGANRDGIHYPGPRVRLPSSVPVTGIKLEVCDSVGEPNPLVIRRHEIAIHPEPGSLTVSETILVDNPGTTCYVGKATQEGVEPVTFQLAIPSDFERTTFQKEFFGRSFSLANGKLVTGIPWTPGRRELQFTYVLRNEQRYRLWKRPLDLPCSHVRVTVRSDDPEEVSCNLPGRSVGQDGAAVFDSAGQTLPAGHVLQVELGRLPVPWMAYASWIALATLIGLIGVVGLLVIRRRRLPPAATGADHLTARSQGPVARRSKQRKPAGRRRGKRKASSRRAA